MNIVFKRKDPSEFSMLDFTVILDKNRIGWTIQTFTVPSDCVLLVDLLPLQLLINILYCILFGISPVERRYWSMEHVIFMVDFIAVLLIQNCFEI
jgi:glucan phosphoethanolaminetransferase (alkaline phosphatase superfamily)